MSTEPQPRLEKTVEQLTKRVAKGGGFALSGQVLARLFGFVLQVVLGRFLGTAAYGLYALGVNTVNLAGQISMLGLGNGLLRFVSLYHGEGSRGKLKGALFLSLSLGAVLSIAVSLTLVLLARRIATGIFHEPRLYAIIRVFSIVLPFYVFMSLVQSAIRGFQRIDHYAMVGVLRSIANISIVSIVFVLGYRLYGAAFAFIVSTVLAGALATYLLARNFQGLLSHLKPVFETKRILRFSIPLYLAGFSYLLMARIDIFMIQYFMQSANVGVYRSAVVLAGLVNLPLLCLNTAFAPMISDLHNRKKLSGLAKLFKTSTRWITAGSVLVALLLFSFSRELLTLWGTEFTAGQAALIVLILSQLVNVSVGSVGFMLQMSGHQDYVLFNNLFTVALNIALNIWLIPVYGILGAALATGLSLVANNLLGSIEVFKLLRMHPWDRDHLRVAAPLVFSLIAFFLLQRTNAPWFLDAAAMVITFMAGFFLLGLTPEDKIVMAAIKRKILR